MFIRLLFVCVLNEFVYRVNLLVGFFIVFRMVWVLLVVEIICGKLNSENGGLFG